MPCYDAQTAYMQEQARKEREADPFLFAKNDIIRMVNYYDQLTAKVAAQNHKLTDMLCRVMGDIQYQEPTLVIDADVKEWWEEHKKWDAERNKT